MNSDEARVVWISGAGSGVGRAVALSAARAGWKVVLSGRRRDALEATAEQARAFDSEAMVVPLDVTGGDVRGAATHVMEEWGRVDALVLAAGLNTPRRSWVDQTMTEFAQVTETNLGGVARTVDAALPALRATGGVVVVVSSYAAWTYSPLAGVAYSASKTALGVLVRTLNTQEAGHGIRACHLCPGDIDTDFLKRRPRDPDSHARARMLAADDVARAVQFVLDSPAHVRMDEIVLSPLSQL